MTHSYYLGSGGNPSEIQVPRHQPKTKLASRLFWEQSQSCWAVLFVHSPCGPMVSSILASMTLCGHVCILLNVQKGWLHESPNYVNLPIQKWKRWRAVLWTIPCEQGVQAFTYVLSKMKKSCIYLEFSPSYLGEEKEGRVTQGWLEISTDFRTSSL